MLKPIKQLVSEIILELGLPDANDTPIIKVWIMEGMGEIGNSRLQAKETDWMLVSDLAVTKPKDMIAPVRVLLSIDKKHCIMPYISADIVRCGCCENSNHENKAVCREVTMGETQTEFYFSSNALKYNACKIFYVGMPCDENGEPLVDDEAKRAVKQYVKTKIVKRDRMRNRQAVPMSEVQYEDQQWVILKNQAAGRINMPSLVEMPSIVDQFYNAGITINMIVDRYTGWYVGYGNTHL